MADWLQGPYVYALYHAYGYSQHDIAVLFIAGFGSSAVFGSFIGGMADWVSETLCLLSTRLSGLSFLTPCACRRFN